MTRQEIDLTADIIDIRDIIARVEELESEVDANGEGEHIAEWKALTAILADLAGAGGDEHWRGDWYPLTLIRDSYFQEYAQQLAEDIGAINPNATWPNNCIDWEQAARELRMDYTSTDIGGATYYFR